ncbi:hypothetical protein NL108_015804 [Boleophthalmus pectinirostris]|uniref:leucine-rich repeat-containing protein 73 n=1 Tax=Boleophthalmus pectinirostris TaxID=150288 RepID=UPI0024327C0D|nr:leucine-rich repeat-containing protein 73 [Boleophthalmus pectinirostris]KAJ0067300.1 hypothetical protein NL108_015804 [Boleophthalmus pectinirostris]
MVPVCVQFCGEHLGPDQVQWVCAGLDRAQLLSLRGCRVSDQDFGRICESAARSRTLVQLNLSLGVASGPDRIKDLARALDQNRSLQTLFLHGNRLSGPESLVLTRSLVLHPALVSLDLGDCSLTDQVLNQVCGLLPPDGARPGLQELSLSSNPGVSARAWTRLCVALAHSAQLRVLRLDYNPLGDRIAEMLAVAVASSRTLETLDLEGTGLSNQTGQVFLDLLLFYPVSLKVLVLAENQISPEVQTQIQDLLSESEDEPIRDQRLQQQPIREERDWLPHSGAHTVLLTSGLGDSLLDETEM